MGDIVRGESHPVTDPRIEPVDFYKTSGLSLIERIKNLLQPGGLGTLRLKSIQINFARELGPAGYSSESALTHDCVPVDDTDCAFS